MDAMHDSVDAGTAPAAGGDSQDVVVVGLGYVGLPLVVEMARSGHRVFGLERNETIVAGLLSGTSHIDDIPDATIAELLTLGFRPLGRRTCSLMLVR